MRFCDENNDRKITSQEWMDCFSVLQDRKPVTGRKNRGKNPLDKYLKND